MREGETKFLQDCLLCRRQFQYGPHRYDGKPVHAWKGNVCNSCIACNQEGIVPGTYRAFEAHLKSHGVQVQYNEDGWIDWPPGAPIRRIRIRFTTP